jgi:hypothetical protein
MTADELRAEAWQQSIGSLDDVRFARSRGSAS